MIFQNVVVGTPVCEPWQMFSTSKQEWDTRDNKNVLFTEERFLPKILIECGIVKSINEVRKNKPELVKSLNTVDFIEIKWGKKRIFIQVGK